MEIKYTNKNYRLGAFAKSDIEKNEVYFKISIDKVMNGQNIFETKLSQFMDAYIENYGSVTQNHMVNFQLLLFYFMVQKKNPESFWKPYLDVLPDNFNHLIQLNLQAIEELQGLQLQQDLKKYEEKLQQNFESKKKQIFPLLEKILDTEHEVFTLENYIYANRVLDSRSIWFKGVQHLIPVLDMINCCGDTAKDKPYMTELSGNMAYTTSQKKVQKNEEILVNYGQPNHIYMMYHGFTIDDNENDCFQFAFRIVKDKNVFHYKKKIENLYKLDGASHRAGRHPEGSYYHLECFNPNNFDDTYLRKLMAIGLNESTDLRDRVSQLIIVDEILDQLKTFQNQFKNNLQQDLKYLQNLVDKAENIPQIQAVKFRIQQRNLAQKLIDYYYKKVYELEIESEKLDL